MKKDYSIPTISIIVPVYNVEIYLTRCIESILVQSLKEFELLLIDDGSQDNSGKICDRYAQKDKRIKVYHNTNYGVSSTRNFGVEHSSGEYIMFIDSDDWIPQHALDTLLQFSLKHNLDISIGGYIIAYKNKQKVKSSIYRIYYQQELYIKDVLKTKVNIGPCGKLYKSTILKSGHKDTKFPNFPKGEDYLFNIGVSMHIQSAGCISIPVYYYYQRNNSTVYTFKHSLEYEKKFDEYTTWLFKNNNLFYQYQTELRHIRFMQLYTLLKNGIRIDSKDNWVYNICKEGDFIQLTLKEQIVLACIKYPLLQKILHKNLKILYKLYKLIK